MFKSRIVGAVALAGAVLILPIWAVAQAPAPTPAAAPAAPVDYSNDEAWLCRPGRQDACSRANEDATIVKADGTLAPAPFHPAAEPSIDCFYVYPTVSRDKTPNASMAVEPEEVQVVEQQFARFSSKCRLFAPLYRQVTLTALQAAMMGHPMPADRAMAYGDVLAAWKDYLARDNNGRGVVLIGHSQGSGVLIELVKREIDGRPVAGRLLSVILGGARLQVPIGKDVGGDFASIPLCRFARQLGCAINFASFRAESPPPANSRFGAPSGPGLEAACVNPAKLEGGEGPLHAYLASGTQKIVAADARPPKPWTNPPQAVTTPFVEVPGLLSAHCEKDAAHTWLAITTHPDPAGHRVNEIDGDIVIGGNVLKDWGLHLIDMNLAMGDLVRIVGEEGHAFGAKNH
jgi:hypothetical protein